MRLFNVLSAAPGLSWAAVEARQASTVLKARSFNSYPCNLPNIDTVPLPPTSSLSLREEAAPGKDVCLVPL